ncbi:MAG: hypothetical protein H7645_02635 [Candidatus Heimdallarchaeota archaeon]|nr:hypothetical protein [Candidatus Heimdallarchaeota archaeon]MCK4769212.1 hypothetical protein [Candidatus Heimdallarchaeota archaeon]
MSKNFGLKVGLCLIIALFATTPFSNVSNAIVSLPITENTFSQTGELIQAFNGNMSDTSIIRGDTIYFYATLANLGDQSVTVISLNAEFVHAENSTQFNRRYTVEFDRDHRSIGPEDSFTATMEEVITNAEASYYVSIFFVAENVYDESSDFGPPALNYTAVEDVLVSVVDLGSSSNVIIGIGITFGVIVLIVIGIIVYGWLKEKLSKRKY